MAEKIESVRIEVRTIGDQMQASINMGGKSEVILGSIGFPLVAENHDLMEAWKALMVRGFGEFVARYAKAEVISVHEVRPGERPS